MRGRPVLPGLAPDTRSPHPTHSQPRRQRALPPPGLLPLRLLGAPVPALWAERARRPGPGHAGHPRCECALRCWGGWASWDAGAHSCVVARRGRAAAACPGSPASLLLGPTGPAPGPWLQRPQGVPQGTHTAAARCCLPAAARPAAPTEPAPRWRRARCAACCARRASPLPRCWRIGSTPSTGTPCPAARPLRIHRQLCSQWLRRQQRGVYETPRLAAMGTEARPVAPRLVPAASSLIQLSKQRIRCLCLVPRCRRYYIARA